MGDPVRLPKLPVFDPNELQFDLYMSLIQANFDSYGITDSNKKKNLLLISIGTKIFSTLANLTAPETPTEKSYEQIAELLKNHYVTKPSYHRSLLLFQQRRKGNNESMKELYSDLKRLAKDCSFGATFDMRLRDQLFMAVDALPYFKFLVAEDLNLESLSSSKLLDRIQTLEKAHMGEGNAFDSATSVSINKIRSSPNPTSIVCKHCGFPHPSSACQFKHLNCRKCGRKGHLEKVCYSKDSTFSNKLLKNNNKHVSNFRKHNVKHVAENNDCFSSSNLDINNEDDNMLMNVYDIGNSINIVKPNIYKFEINGNFIPLEIDSGACVSLISEKYCKDMNLDIDASCKSLSAYGGNKILVKGQVPLKIKFNTKSVDHVFYVTNSNCNNLCGRDLMKKLDIKLTGVDDNSRVNKIDVKYELSELLDDYTVSDDLPVVDVEARIYLKENSVPKFIKARQVPLAHKELVQDALDDLVNNKIIEPVAYSDWASPIVPVLKKNACMCRFEGFKF